MRPRGVALLLALVAAPGVLGAQLPGVAHRNAGVTRGLQLAVEAGFPNDQSYVGTAFGGSAAFGIGLVGITATATTWERDFGTVAGRDRSFGVGATGNLRLLGGPLVPLSITLQAGAARWTEPFPSGDVIADETISAYPVGLGFALVIPSPIVSLKPWLAPRVQWTVLPGDERSTDVGVGGGIDLGFINGTSIRGAYDRVFIEGADRTVWSVGLAHSLRVGR